MVPQTLNDQAKPPVPQPEARAVAPVALHSLGYDELPVGSNLRRVYGDDGSVTISAPAGEPSEAVVRAASHRTGISSAIVSSAALIGVVILFYLGLGVGRRLDLGLRLLAAAMFTLLCLGVFLLVWRVRFAARMHDVSSALRQATVLHADSARLIIETTGPGGDGSIELAAKDIAAIEIAGQTWHGDGKANDSVPFIKVTLRNGPCHRLLPGHHESELRWVAAALTQALRPTGR